MKRTDLVSLFGAGVLAALAAQPAPASAGTVITEQEAHAIGVDAYLYFYPLATMDITRRVATNVEAGIVPGFGPANKFQSFTAYPTADYKVRCLCLARMANHRNGGSKLSRDTPRLDRGSAEWVAANQRADAVRLDHRANQDGRSGRLRRSSQDTGRVQDHPAVAVGQSCRNASGEAQVDTMTSGKFFAYASELLEVNPPHVTDEPMIARLKQIGFEPGKGFDLEKADPAVRAALADVPEEAQQLMAWKVPTLARFVNGWSMNIDTMGVYGNYYLKRAIIAREGLGANLPEDAIYPLNIGDETGKPLDGANKYTLHFDKGNVPPARAFWSVTLYDADGFQVANPLNRFAVSSWMPFKYNADGSLDLYFQNESPANGNEANWLPAPKGPFTLTMRLFAPRSEALVGKWNPPPVTRAQPITGMVAQ
jgi:hypothetical protein